MSIQIPQFELEMFTPEEYLVLPSLIIPGIRVEILPVATIDEIEETALMFARATQKTSIKDRELFDTIISAQRSLLDGYRVAKVFCEPPATADMLVEELRKAV